MGSQQRKCFMGFHCSHCITTRSQQNGTSGGHHGRDRREHGHRRPSRQADVTGNGVVLSPVPPLLAEKRRKPDTRDRDVSRDVSVQPLVSPSRRQSQQPNLSNAPTSQHPYASAPTSANYRTSGAVLGRHSPNAQAMQNGVALHISPSDPYYLQSSVIKNASNSRENMMNSGVNAQHLSNSRMGMYDQGRNHLDDEHNRKRGLLNILCCRP